MIQFYRLPQDKLFRSLIFEMEEKKSSRSIRVLKKDKIISRNHAMRLSRLLSQNKIKEEDMNPYIIDEIFLYAKSEAKKWPYVPVQRKRFFTFRQQQDWEELGRRIWSATGGVPF